MIIKYIMHFAALPYFHSRFTVIEVCHCWQNIAFGNPSLWSDFDLKDKIYIIKNQLKLFRPQSNNLLLKIFHGPYSCLTLPFEPFIFDSFSNLSHRIKSLHIYIKESSDWEHWTAMLNRGTPVLKELTLINYTHSRMSVPPKLWLSSNSLISLELQDLPIPLESSLLLNCWNLTKLNLQKRNMLSDSPIKIEHLWEILEKCNKLQCLIIGVDIILPEEDTHGVELPHLNWLELKLRFEERISFLHSLVLPYEVCLTLTFFN